MPDGVNNAINDPRFGINAFNFNNPMSYENANDFAYYPGMNNMGMGMDSSIFGSMNGGMMGGMNMPFMPGFTGGMNSDSYWKNMESYYDGMINSQVRQRERSRDADLKMNVSQEGVEEQAKLLKEKIMQDEQEQIQEVYNAYKESIRSLYGAADEKQLNIKAATLYSQINKSSIREDIRKDGKDSFVQGMVQTATFGMGDKITAEENISQITGSPVARWENTKKDLGHATAGAGMALAAGLLPGIRKIVFCNKWTAGITMLAGALAGWSTGLNFRKQA